MPIPANTGSLGSLFTFSRARTGAYTDAAGLPAEALVNQPRIDHAPDGAAIGLLIEGRSVDEKVDRLRLLNSLPGSPAFGTILHDYITVDGEHRRVAIYTRAPQAAINARLALCGHHRHIGFFPQFLERQMEIAGGPVRFAGLSWEMAGLVLVAERAALDTTGAGTKLLIEA